MIACFDTNVLVSALATRGLCADLLRVVLAEHEFLIGRTVLAELPRVLQRKFRVGVTAIAEADAFLRAHARVIDAAPPPAGCSRASGDARVLAEAVAGQADVLVTGDRDLLEMAAAAPLRILSPRGLWGVLRRPGA